MSHSLWRSSGDDQEKDEDGDTNTSLPGEGQLDATDSEDEDSNGPSAMIEEETSSVKDPRATVLSVLELENLFVQSAPDLSCT